MSFLSRLFGGDKTRDHQIDSAIAALRGKTVAAVESSNTIRKVLELAMAQAGVNWLGFSSTQELLAAVSPSKPHVAILNAGDLGGDIASVVNQIKSEFAGIRIVLLTDLAHDLDAVAASQLGVDAVHRKPFNAEELLASVARIVR